MIESEFNSRARSHASAVASGSSCPITFRSSFSIAVTRRIDPRCLLFAAIALGLTVALPSIGARLVAPDSIRCSPDERRVLQKDPRSGFRLPFAANESLEYNVSFGHLRVGTAAMQIATDTVDGRSVWRAQLTVDGGFMMLSVHDTSISWFDTATFDSRRFYQGLHEPRYHANRDTRIWPERNAYQQNGDDEQSSVADPLDDVSMLYLVRGLPLEPGQCYEFRRYFQPQGNPIVIHVVRRESIEVPAGRFDAIVVQPEVTTAGIFSQNGHAEVWLSDDSSRVLLQLKSRLAFGSINLYLRRVVKPGR